MDNAQTAHNKMLPTHLRTPRLLLRRWQDADIQPFAQMCADDRVMEFFPRKLNAQEATAMVSRIEASFDENELGLWAVEITQTHEFIGFIGLSKPKFDAHFTPCVEIGWRLDSNHWGRGYAPEGAAAVMVDAFERLKLDEIVSMTTVNNAKSRRVMEKLGLIYHPEDDFEHPLVEDGHPLKAHVLYRINQERYNRLKLTTGIIKQAFNSTRQPI